MIMFEKEKREILDAALKSGDAISYPCQEGM